MGWIILIIFFVIILAISLKGAGFFQPFGKEHTIPLTEIELVGFILSPPSAFSHRLMGKVINRSTRYTLTELALEITILDYTDGNIVEQRDETMRIHVPPGQAREIVEYVHLSSGTHPFAKIYWRYRLLYAKGT